MSATSDTLLDALEVVLVRTGGGRLPHGRPHALALLS